MRWISTRGGAPPVTFREALFEGLAPDGGLYLPEHLEPLPASTLAALQGASLATVGAAITVHLIENEIPRTAIEQIVARALDFPIPLVGIDAQHVYALELFHGPTFAFKDVGARTMARLMAYFVAAGDYFTVLVATSGDTGSAVAQAFAGLPGTRVIVLFPEGQVTAVQEAQFTTLGGNVKAVAVQGTFDDCQAMVKAAFADADLRKRVGLTSANSINVGRLLPQIFYYAWASLEMGGPKAVPSTTPAVFSVPSGNFGNLTAGLIARRLGFPIDRFVAATNVNDVVPEYLASGHYAPRPSVRTVANAMDVGAPSNFERMRALYNDDVEQLRRDVRGIAFDDEAVRRAIREVYQRHGYVLDPHSAIAWLGLGGAPGIFVATAHPAKFREVVEPAVGHQIELPSALRDALERTRHVTRVAARYEDLRDRIL
jgi:threonine synthase